MVFLEGGRFLMSEVPLQVGSRAFEVVVLVKQPEALEGYTFQAS